MSASYMTGVLAFVNRVLHRHNRLDDVIAMWNVRRARDAAWVNGEVLWALRRDASLRAEFVATLDRTTGFAGRGLLVPTETRLRRLGGRLFGR